MLSDTQAKELIDSPKNASLIQAAKTTESKLRVFTEALDKQELSKEVYWANLLTMMKNRSSKKFDRVVEFLRYPLPVVQLSESVLSEYYRVFTGKNRYFGYEANRNTPLLDEWQKETDLAKWIEAHAKDVLKNQPCSFVVIDADNENKPYPILVTSDRLVDAGFKDKDGQLSYIVFVHSTEIDPNDEDNILINYAIYDDECFRVLQKNENTNVITEIANKKHNIGYCPAHAFIKSLSNSKNPFKRKSVFDGAVSKLEDYTLFDCYRNYVDHYAPFPITEAPENPCANPECMDGKVPREVIDQTAPRGFRNIWETCKVCDGGDKGENIMPGTHLGIKVNQDPKMNDGSGVFRMIFPETDKLDYVPKKLENLETEIRYKTVGVNDMVTKEAINELQAKGSFSSMESVLLRAKDELDYIYKWALKTIGRLIYQDLDIKVEANFGTEFYLVTEDDLQKRYQMAKDSGLPAEELRNIYTQIVETKYRGNPAKLKRQKMILDVDPLPTYSLEDCINMKKEGVIDDFEFSLKVNFLNFIAKFESKNAPIIQFGLSLEYWNRVDIIKSTIMQYNQELLAEKAARTP